MQLSLLRCSILAFLGLIIASPLPAADALRPNIVVILADDLGSHDVGWRGSDIKTPHLDALANAGAKLDQHYVQPVCSPTRAALLTGRYPFRYGFQTGVVRPWATYGLPLEERLLSQALHDAGYETAIVGKWHLGHFQREYLPTQRGFDHQYGHYNGALDYFTHIRDEGFDWHKNDKVNRDEGYSTHLVGKEASRLIVERDAKKPLFLYVPFNGVHGPLQVPAEYAERYPQYKGNRRTYAGMVTALDEAVGKIVDTLREQKLLDNTLIIFSSDNGGPSPGTLTSNGVLRAGKGTVYEGGVRVCAFAHWPQQIPSGSVVNTPIHVTDWYPTLLNVAGAKLDQPLPIDGHDILPVLTKGASSPREFVLINAAPQGGALRVGDWKLVVGGEADQAGEETPEAAGKKKKAGAKGRVELFNLANDVSEKHNLASEQPEKLKALQAQYEALAKQAVPPKLAPKAANFKTPKVWGEAE